MRPIHPKPLDACFEEGLRARREGRGRHENPYAAGSAERREWRAGYCATADRDAGEDGGAFGPSLEAPHRRESD